MTNREQHLKLSKTPFSKRDTKWAAHVQALLVTAGYKCMQCGEDFAQEVYEDEQHIQEDKICALCLVQQKDVKISAA